MSALLDDLFLRTTGGRREVRRDVTKLQAHVVLHVLKRVCRAVRSLSSHTGGGL